MTVNLSTTLKIPFLFNTKTLAQHLNSHKHTQAENDTPSTNSEQSTPSSSTRQTLACCKNPREAENEMKEAFTLQKNIVSKKMGKKMNVTVKWLQKSYENYHLKEIH